LEERYYDASKKLTDSIITMAVRKMPAGVYAFSGNKIVEKLIKRRDGLMKYAVHYYKFLAANSVVFGTDKNEF
jgi:hypothetical protein